MYGMARRRVWGQLRPSRREGGSRTAPTGCAPAGVRIWWAALMPVNDPGVGCVLQVFVVMVRECGVRDDSEAGWCATAACRGRFTNRPCGCACCAATNRPCGCACCAATGVSNGVC